MDIYSIYSETLRDYPVYFYNGEAQLQYSRVYYGTYAEYEGDETMIKKIIGGEPSNYYEFAKWVPSLSEPITGPMTFKAEFNFDGYIDEEWSTIASNVALGNKEAYGYGGKKIETITYHINGNEYTEDVEFEIIGRDHNDLAEEIIGYNNNSNKAGLTFRGVLRSFTTQMNKSGGDFMGTTALDSGGWSASVLRK
jgi:hypothetical protein